MAKKRRDRDRDRDRDHYPPNKRPRDFAPPQRPLDTASRRQQPVSSASTIRAAFDTFSGSLATLLSHGKEDTTAALTTEQCSLLEALREMKVAGELSFLPQKEAPKLAAAASWPPSLPQVFSESLRKQAFTHRSCIMGEHASDPGVENMHYERLEYLGDAYLQAISSQLLYSRFPTLREGDLSSMRQEFVANTPLLYYAQLYDMQKQLREGKGQSVTLTKTVADCFESYIGAIITERGPTEGLKVVMDWLAELFEPKLNEFEQMHTTLPPVNKMAKQSLNALLGGNSATIDYRWTGGPGGNKGGFWVTVFLTAWGFEDRPLRRGFGHNKSDAQLRAAMNTLADAKLCEEIIAAKEKVLGPKPVKHAEGKPQPASGAPATKDGMEEHSKALLPRQAET